MDGVPLNKYLASAGIASRRASAVLIKEGAITVNGVSITNPAHRVGVADDIVCAGKKASIEDKVYILLNKLSGYVTTASDEKKRPTVLDLLGERCRQRVYPVGRLDQDTTGLLLLTNDGDFAQCMAHPKHGMRKIYHVTLASILLPMHEYKIRKGVMLEDGLVKVDKLVILEGSNRCRIAVTLHSGRYRVVRRLFEHFGYRVENLDRPIYGSLTKQGLKPGGWRFLSQEEVATLQLEAQTTPHQRIPKVTKR